MLNSTISSEGITFRSRKIQKTSGQSMNYFSSLADMDASYICGKTLPEEEDL
jgi:hypothetical protein